MISSHNWPPVTTFSVDEEMVRDLCRKWANDELKPIVRVMDEEATLREKIIQDLFENGLMGMVSSLCQMINVVVFLRAVTL